MKLFNKWESEHMVIKDQSLQGVLMVNPQLVPQTQGRHAHQRFYKNKSHVVERLIMRMMVPGHRGKKHVLSSGKCSGRYVTNAKIVMSAFARIEEKMKQNPVQVFVTALENAAPREEITTIEYGGARYPQAVDCSPQRKVDVALRMMVQGSYQKSYGKKVKMSDALADEIMNAYNLDQKSAAIAKKLEMERMADAAR